MAAKPCLSDLIVMRNVRLIPNLATRFSQRVHQLLQRLALKLADALAGQPQVFADFPQGHGVVTVEAKPHANDGRLAIFERAQELEDAIEIVRLDQLDFGTLYCGRRSSTSSSAGPSSSRFSECGVRLLTRIALATMPSFFFESRSALPTSSSVGSTAQAVRPERTWLASISKAG